MPSLGIIADPLHTLVAHKDSSIAILREASLRGYTLYFMRPQDIRLHQGVVSAKTVQITLKEKSPQWFEPLAEVTLPLHTLDVLFMRKDPPVNIDYINTTYLLELAEKQGANIINRPSALRDANEKCYIAQFPECIPPTYIGCCLSTLHAFIAEHHDVVVKPLDNKGGQGVLRLTQGDPNTAAILDLLTQSGCRYIMAQRFIPEVVQGDKRVILIEGQPVPHALARIPCEDDWRGNMVLGAKPQAQSLTARDLWICEQIGPTLKKHGLFFVGIDIIGDYLTEINVTSPTGIQELDAACQLNIAGIVLDSAQGAIR